LNDSDTLGDSTHLNGGPKATDRDRKDWKDSEWGDGGELSGMIQDEKAAGSDDKSNSIDEMIRGLLGRLKFHGEEQIDCGLGDSTHLNGGPKATDRRDRKNSEWGDGGKLSGMVQYEKAAGPDDKSNSTDDMIRVLLGRLQFHGEQQIDCGLGDSTHLNGGPKATDRRDRKDLLEWGNGGELSGMVQYEKAAPRDDCSDEIIRVVLGRLQFHGEQQIDF